jgi:uncharacterized protein (TIGR00369 family)
MLLRARCNNLLKFVRQFGSCRGCQITPLLQNHFVLKLETRQTMIDQQFTPRDPSFAEKTRASFTQQGFMKYLGAEITAIEPGHCEIRVPFRPELSQQDGYFHGGVSGAIADSATGYAAYSLTPPDTSVLSVEYKLNFVAPALGELLIARGQVIRAGRTLTVCRADVHVVRDGVEKICATLLSTIIALSTSASVAPKSNPNRV